MPDVDVAVGAVRDHAPVVVRVGLLDEEQLLRAPGQALGAVGAVAHDARVAAPIGVVDDEGSARRVVGGEGEAEQALFAPCSNLAAQVEERLGANGAVLEHADQAALLDDVQPLRLVRGRGREERGIEPVGHLDEAQGGGGAVGAAGDEREQRGAGE